MTGERTILLTGFPGRRQTGDNNSNPTGQIARQLDGERVGAWRVDGQLIDCELEERLDKLRQLMKVRPRLAVLSLGMTNTPGFILEEVGNNIIDTTDNPSQIGGKRRTPIVPGLSHSGYVNNTIHLGSMAGQLYKAGFQAEVSDNPGTLGCNTVAFAGLHLHQEYPKTRMLFMHIPYNLSCALQAKADNPEKEVYSMPIERTNEGVLIVLKSLAQYAINRTVIPGVMPKE